MTEEEIEDLQWQLGDFGPVNRYGSRGRKRSKEDVINMTIEEMEAEIQETNEAIRKRRSRNPGLMLKPLRMLTASMSMKEKLRQVRGAICENRRDIAAPGWRQSPVRTTRTASYPSSDGVTSPSRPEERCT
jgi:hypothetical protein